MTDGTGRDPNAERRLVRVVCSRAHDADDARFLLDALGLVAAVEELGALRDLGAGRLAS